MFQYRILPAFLACVMCVTLILPCSVEAVTINQLKDQASSLATKKNDIKKKLASLSEDKDQAMERKAALDEQCDVIQEEIDVVNQQIAYYDALILQTEQQIAETEQKEETQYELFCKRVRAMEENGTVSYWEVIFKATNFSDLLSRLDFINEIMDYDKRVMEELKEIRAKLAEEKESLKVAKAEQVTAKTELENRKAELQEQLDEANALMQKIHADEKTYKDTLNAIDKEEDEIQAKIVELSKQNNQSNQNATTSVNGYTMAKGGYMWPTPSHRVTSPFGPRKSPGGIGSTNHKGIDIGSVWYSTEIVASKAGTVIVSQYSKSYGNYVVVSHGSGKTTLYAHMSKRLVSAGQAVKQGQVLGISGSTGNSTGPHLHFEITEGGVRVDPLKYLTDYVKSW